MIIKDGTNPKIEKEKERLGLTGDVYIDDAHHIESLYSHVRLLSENKYPSTAATIEEAEVERYAFEEEMERRRREQPEPELTLDDALEMLRELGVNVDDN